jgi:hypothetical protein
VFPDPLPVEPALTVFVLLHIYQLISEEFVVLIADIEALVFVIWTRFQMEHPQLSGQ